jgi:hypothetical protein
MRIALGLVLVSLNLALPERGAAQGPGPSVLWRRPLVLATSPSDAFAAERYAGRAPDYRWEGMAVGAGAGAIAFGLLGAVLCSQSESTDDCTGMVIGTGLLGAFCGGITGGLIGGSIPKGESGDSTSESS